MLTAARVNIEWANNATASDAFQFGTAGDTSWSFSGQTFKMEIKANKFDVTPILTLTSAGGTIVVDDVVQRILHFNVPDATIQASLPIAEYQYDLVMIDGSTPAIRVPLMRGEIKVRQGVTEN
jgi:hypothetical protein